MPHQQANKHSTFYNPSNHHLVAFKEKEWTNTHVVFLNRSLNYFQVPANQQNHLPASYSPWHSAPLGFQMVTEGSLEIKLPIYEDQRREKEKKEDPGAPRGRKAAKHRAFSNDL